MWKWLHQLSVPVDVLHFNSWHGILKHAQCTLEFPSSIICVIQGILSQIKRGGNRMSSTPLFLYSCFSHTLFNTHTLHAPFAITLNTCHISIHVTVQVYSSLFSVEISCSKNTITTFHCVNITRVGSLALITALCPNAIGISADGQQHTLQLQMYYILLPEL